MPSGSVTGVISRSQKPFLMACSARFCDRTPNSSISWRLMPFQRARFSAVWPIAMYASGTMPSSRGSCQAEPSEAATSAVRASASAKKGLCVSGSESELPFTKRDTISTPAEMKTSPSPALMACSAMREVWSEEEQ